MKSVRMSKGWKVDQQCGIPTRFCNEILVCNYESLNEVWMNSLHDAEIYRHDVQRRYVGVWKPKK